LSVAVNVEPPDHAPALNRILPDRRMNRPPPPCDVAWKADVNRQKSRHQCSLWPAIDRPKLTLQFPLRICPRSLLFKHREPINYLYRAWRHSPKVPPKILNKQASHFPFTRMAHLLYFSSCNPWPSIAMKRLFKDSANVGCAKMPSRITV